MATECLIEETDGVKSFAWTIAGGLFVVVMLLFLASKYVLEVIVWGQLVTTLVLIRLEGRKDRTAGDLTK